MTDSDEGAVERSHRWAIALTSALRLKLDQIASDFTVELADVNTPDIQNYIHIRSNRVGAPVLTIVCETSLAVLEIDRVPGVGVLYEFLDNPQDIGDNEARRSARSRAGGALSEFDLIDHVAGVVSRGYEFLRIPLYERLRLRGFADLSDFNWVTIDLGWPPIYFSRWAPK